LALRLNDLLGLTAFAAVPLVAGQEGRQERVLALEARVE
jgi:hypothetical protein